MAGRFTLNARLAADSVPLCRLPLCEARLMRERRWLWLLLVPRVAGAEEIFDLSAAQQAQLAAETGFAARALKQIAAPCDKINIGALGNIVRQLHIHIVARAEGDAGWPGPVWGLGAAELRAEAEIAGYAARLRAEFAKIAG